MAAAARERSRPSALRWRGAAALGVAGLAVAAAALALSDASRLDGVVVDAVSGRVAAGTVVTFNDRILRRFASSAFSFAGRRRQALPLVVNAPGYAPMTIEIGRRQRSVRVELQPVAIAGWSGLVVFPMRRGPELSFETQLQGADGKAMAEFPAVPMRAFVEFLDKTGTPIVSAPLAVDVDWRGREIAVTLRATASDQPIIAGSAGDSFVVRLEAGGEARTTRRFPVTPELFSAAISP